MSYPTSGSGRISIIRSDPRGLAEARRVAESQGFDVEHAVLREPGQPLAPLLRDITGGTLVVEGSCQSPEDVVALEKATVDHPGLVVLLLCPSRDSAGLLAAMRAGVREVLQSPAAAADLGGALARLARRRPRGPQEGTIVTFISCKGGSGATFLAANFAHQLAALSGRKTGFIDLDLDYGDASFFVTTQSARATVADVARQIERLDPQFLASSMLAVTPNFSILPAPTEAESALSVKGPQLERLLDVARATFDFVVVDLQRAFDSVAVMALDKADVIYAVMENMIPYIRDAKRLARTFHALGYPASKVRLVVNRFERGSDISIAEIEQAVGLKVHHTVPNSWSDVAKSVNLGVPLAEVNRRNPILHALGRMVAEVVDAAPAGRSAPRTAMAGSQ